MSDVPIEAKPKSKTTSWLIGCTIAIFATGLLCAGGAWFGFKILKEKTIEMAHEGLTTMVDESGLPESQITSMKADIDRLRDAALDGRINFEGVEGLEVEFERVISLGIVQWYSVAVIESVTMPEDEKADARRTMERLARGIQDGTLELRDVDGFHVEVDEEGADGWSVEDVRTDVARVKTVVDAAGIPDEPFQADVAAEFSQLIDGMMVE